MSLDKLGAVTTGLLSLNMMASDGIHIFAKKIHAPVDSISKWNYVWIIPANVGVAIVGLASAPVFFILNILAADLFVVVGLASSNPVTPLAVEKHLFQAGAQVTEVPLNLIVRIFRPTFIETPVMSKFLERRQEDPNFARGVAS